MFDKIKKNLFSKNLFMAASIAALIVFGALYFLLLFGFGSQGKDYNVENNNYISDKYYLNENYQDTDPYITKVPGLRDMLAGPIISGNDPSLGPAEAEITIVEFSDFECGFCRQQEKVLAEIVDKYKNKIKLVWKDYPDSDPESISYRAAAAARCAQAQGLFWPYHDGLYQNSGNISEELLSGIADSLDMDKNLFERCLAQGAGEKLVRENIEEANALDINGIPFIYVNDQQIMGEVSFEDLEKIVNIELGRQNY